MSRIAMLPDLKKFIVNMTPEIGAIKKRILETRSFERRITRRVHQNGPDISASISNSLKYGYEIDRKNPYGKTIEISGMPNFTTDQNIYYGRRKNHLLIGWKRKRSKRNQERRPEAGTFTWRGFKIWNFFKGRSTPIHLFSSDRLYLFTFNGTNGYGPPHGMKPEILKDGKTYHRKIIIT